MIKHIVSYVFSIPFANFLCLVAAIVYLAKTKFIPSIDAAIKEKEQAKQNLKNLAEQAEKDRITVEQNNAEQKLYAQQMLERLKDWNDAIEQAYEQEAKGRLEGMRAISNLIKKQEQYLAKRGLVKQLTPQVMQQATEELTKLFKDRDKQSAYLSTALKELEQELL